MHLEGNVLTILCKEDKFSFLFVKIAKWTHCLKFIVCQMMIKKKMLPRVCTSWGDGREWWVRFPRCVFTGLQPLISWTTKNVSLATLADEFPPLFGLRLMSQNIFAGMILSKASESLRQTGRLSVIVNCARVSQMLWKGENEVKKNHQGCLMHVSRVWISHSLTNQRLYANWRIKFK